MRGQEAHGTRTAQAKSSLLELTLASASALKPSNSLHRQTVNTEATRAASFNSRPDLTCPEAKTGQEAHGTRTAQAKSRLLELTLT